MTNLPVKSERQLSLIPTSADWAMMKEQAKMLVLTGFLPNAVNTPEKAAAIMLTGRELDLPPMLAFRQLSVIKGKVAQNAELMLAMIQKNVLSFRHKFTVLTNEKCTIKIWDSKTDGQEYSFTMEDAKLANLTNKDNWRMYPRAMLRSRCIAEMARSHYAGAINGLSYTPEEMGANVAEDGSVIDINVEQKDYEPATPGATVETTRSEEIHKNTFEEPRQSLTDILSVQINNCLMMKYTQNHIIKALGGSPKELVAEGNPDKIEAAIEVLKQMQSDGDLGDRE